MDNISEMIVRMCPNGVINYRLGDFCEIKTGRGITKMDASEDGIYPIVSGGIEPMGFYKEYNREAYTVTVSRVGVNAGIVLFHTQQFYLNDKCFSVIPNNQNTIENKFLYYYLCNIEPSIKDLQSEGGVPTINTQKLGSVEIPLPPLPIQQEIVRILDSFTSMITNLETELASRQKQYEYYRNKLLTFDENDKTVEWKTLGECCNRIVDGSHNPPKGVENGKYPMISAQNICDGKITFDDVRWLDEESYNVENKRTKSEIGDVLLTIVGAIGRAAVVKEQFNMTFQRSVCVLKPDFDIIDSIYLYYVLNSNKVQKQINIGAQGAAQKGIYLKQVNTIVVPIPSLHRQQEIVSTLDTFESLISNIKQELEARKKQYEYYREKLLTFE